MISYIDLRPMNDPIRADINSAVFDCMDKSSYLRGFQTKAFEEEWAEFCGQKFAIACNSGTDALTIACRALELKSAQVQANTLPLSAIGLSLGGADVHISEIDREGRIPAGAEESVPVLLFGRIPDADSKDSKLYDAAHAHGWTPPLQSTAAWSFYPTKSLGALGDAGAITTNDENLAQIMIEICGRDDQMRHSRQITSRIDEIQAAILRVKLRSLPVWLHQRQEIASAYDARLGALGITLSGKSFNHIYAIRTSNRDSLRQHLINSGIETKIHWEKSLNQLEGPWTSNGEYPIAKIWAEEILSLPIYPGLSLKEVNFICDSIEEFYVHHYEN